MLLWGTVSDLYKTQSGWEPCVLGYELNIKAGKWSITMFQIQYDGDECRAPNVPYYVAFASIFFLLALVSMVQLIMCVVAEYHKMKSPSVLRACRITTQKLLYFLVFLAAIIRGAYFTSPVVSIIFSRTLLSWSLACKYVTANGDNVWDGGITPLMEIPYRLTKFVLGFVKWFGICQLDLWSRNLFLID